MGLAQFTLVLLAAAWADLLTAGQFQLPNLYSEHFEISLEHELSQCSLKRDIPFFRREMVNGQYISSELRVRWSRSFQHNDNISHCLSTIPARCKLFREIKTGAKLQ